MSDAPHPLALEFADALRIEGTAVRSRPSVGFADTSASCAAQHARRALILGVGSGRNVPPLLDAGLHVDVIESEPQRAIAAVARFAANARVRIVRAPYDAPLPVAFGIDGTLSTHALLHGTPAGIARAIAAIANRSRANAILCATLGCVDDPRFGVGTQIDESTFAPLDGNEAGVPHVYFRADEIALAIAPFTIEAVERVETGGLGLLGAWAHHGTGERIVHWFVRARRP